MLPRDQFGGSQFVSLASMIGYIGWYVSSTTESRLTRAQRFLTSILTGGAATMVDFAVLTALVELFHVAPTRANVPSLLAGAAVQFVGNRHIVFKAGHLAIGPQLLGFLAVELGTFVLNAVSFHLIVKRTSVPYPVVRMLCSFLVFSTFSYPLWKRVFSARSTAQK